WRNYCDPGGKVPPLAPSARPSREKNPAESPILAVLGRARAVSMTSPRGQKPALPPLVSGQALHQEVIALLRFLALENAEVARLIFWQKSEEHLARQHQNAALLVSRLHNVLDLGGHPVVPPGIVVEEDQLTLGDGKAEQWDVGLQMFRGALHKWATRL